jgi:hypothetical protein
MDPPRIFFRVVFFFLDLPPALKKEKEAWDRGAPSVKKGESGLLPFYHTWTIAASVSALDPRGC